MKKLLVGSVLVGMAMVGPLSATVAAWHPQGQIKKSVQNVTAGGQLADANDAKNAVTAHVGDTLKYVIEVSNTGKADSMGMNDMHKTVLTDELPAGVELVSDAGKRKINENLGVIKPGQKVTKEYTVKVKNDQADKAVITNKACFAGNSEVNDAPQSGCDNAVVVVVAPKAEEQPKGQGSTPQVQAASVTTLPETGPALPAGIFTGVSSLGYAVHRTLTRKRK